MGNSTIHKFEADRTSGTEGDCVTLSWECGCPDSVTLTVDNGYRKDSMEVGYDGSTRMVLAASKGKTVYTLTARTNGKAEEMSVTVKVKNTSSGKASKPKSEVGSLKLRLEKFKAWWIQYKYRLKYSWQYMPKKQKILWYVLIGLTVLMLLSGIRNPRHETAAPQHQSTEMTTV